MSVRKVLSIAHVQLAIPPGGEVAARAFYGEVLGFVEVPKPEAMRARGGMWFDAGPVEIHLGIEEGMRPSTKMHPALVVTALDEWLARLSAAGCEWRPATDLPGTRVQRDAVAVSEFCSVALVVRSSDGGRAHHTEANSCKAVQGGPKRLQVLAPVTRNHVNLGPAWCSYTKRGLPR